MPASNVFRKKCLRWQHNLEDQRAEVRGLRTNHRKLSGCNHKNMVCDLLQYKHRTPTRKQIHPTCGNIYPTPPGQDVQAQACTSDGTRGHGCDAPRSGGHLQLLSRLICSSSTRKRRNTIQMSADLCLYHARGALKRRREMSRLRNSARSDGS